MEGPMVTVAQVVLYAFTATHMRIENSPSYICLERPSQGARFPSRLVPRAKGMAISHLIDDAGVPCPHSSGCPNSMRLSQHPQPSHLDNSERNAGLVLMGHHLGKPLGLYSSLLCLTFWGDKDTLLGGMVSCLPLRKGTQSSEVGGDEKLQMHPWESPRPWLLSLWAVAGVWTDPSLLALLTHLPPWFLTKGCSHRL